MEDDLDFLIEVLNKKNSEFDNLINPLQKNFQNNISVSPIKAKRKKSKYDDDEEEDDECNEKKLQDILETKSADYVPSNKIYIANHNKKVIWSTSFHEIEEEKILFNIVNETASQDKIL